VPIVTHVHGNHTFDHSDGYAEAWYLPAATNIPAGFATTGSFYDFFRTRSPAGGSWGPGHAVFEYANDQRATTMWYHDHTLGMTRLNVYAGPAGFYLLRHGPSDLPTGPLPGPAPALGDPPHKDLEPGVLRRYYEIPLAVGGTSLVGMYGPAKDRSFNDDGSLFYPDNRKFFDEVDFTGLSVGTAIY
jgi:hypothetical protein